MSIDREVCKIVRERCSELGLNTAASKKLEFFKVQGKMSKNASIIALVLDGATQKPIAVAKIPRNPKCTLSIDSEFAAMEFMQKNISNWDGAVKIPYQGFLVTLLGAKVLIQRAEFGHSLVREMTDQQNVQRVYSHVLPWLLDFHKSKTKDVTLSGDVLQALVINPIEQFLAKLNDIENVQLTDRVKKYIDQLANDVTGSAIKLCQKHGDFNAHNIIVTDESKSDGFFIIDWEDYLFDQLPIHDINHFFVSNSKLQDMNGTPEQTFEKYMLTDGWYKNAYNDAIKTYESAGFINADVFMKLTPLYMLEICLSLMSEQRQQANTINVWLSRMDKYIDVFLKS